MVTRELTDDFKKFFIISLSFIALALPVYALPTFSNSSPSNKVIINTTSPILSIDIFNSNGDLMNVSFYDNSDDSQISSTQTGISSGETASVIWSELSTGTTYEWYAYINDSSNYTITPIYSFRTKNDTISNFISIDLNEESFTLENKTCLDNKTLEKKYTTELCDESGCKKFTKINNVYCEFGCNQGKCKDNPLWSWMWLIPFIMIMSVFGYWVTR